MVICRVLLARQVDSLAAVYSRPSDFAIAEFEVANGWA
eukprot:CAMPEP_0198214872 /NCGR_PEP_ID=MMETSP1445-20131203/44942_1 /TAXON_ID=36898 /ORGANISM="Pyramimonas sp., Strain CCMP2087" /LENGTH=37 /DNA_ID= /DNA_START= /DNA_END= /DNA_ORIENTATION=